MRLRDLVRDRAVWLYVLITAVFFFRPLTTQTFFFRDLYLFFYPKKVLLAAALRAGTFPLWDPFTSGGQPYLASPTCAALHPSNLLYLVLPTIVAFNVIPVLHVLFCAVAAYWLGRVIGLTQAAAFVTGMVYAFAGGTLSAASLSAWLLALPWFPLTIGLLHRARRDGRSIVPAAIAAAMPLYAGMAELTGLLFLLVIVWSAATRVADLRRSLIVLAGAIGLSLAVTLPATSVIEQSSRATTVRSYESFTSWSVHPRRLPELVVPRFFGRTDTLDDRDYRGRQWETKGFPYVLSIYFGVPVLLLAIAGATRRLDGVDMPRRAVALLALIAILLSLGRHLPGFRLIYDYVPFVTLFRFPVKAVALALLPVALLAGCGVMRIASIARHWILVPITVLLFFALTTPMDPFLAKCFAHAIMATLAVAVVRSPYAIAAVVTVDLLVAGWTVNAYAPRSIFDEPPLASIVRKTIGPMRFHAAPRPIVVRAPSNHILWLAQWQLQTLNEFSATAFGIPVVFHDDYDQLAPAPMARLTGFVRRARWEEKRPALDNAGVRAFLTLDDVRLPGIREIARIDTPSGPLRLYLNPTAAMARFASRDCSGSVRMVRRELNSARYVVDAPCDGRVIFAENHYAGWRATIDGKPAPLEPADFAFTSVAVPKGRHAIERRYFPPRFVAGLIGTLVTAVLMLALALQAHRNR